MNSEKICFHLHIANSLSLAQTDSSKTKLRIAISKSKPITNSCEGCWSYHIIVLKTFAWIYSVFDIWNYLNLPTLYRYLHAKFDISRVLNSWDPYVQTDGQSDRQLTWLVITSKNIYTLLNTFARSWFLDHFHIWKVITSKTLPISCSF